jgi:hypothetical protein
MEDFALSVVLRKIVYDDKARRVSGDRVSLVLGSGYVLDVPGDRRTTSSIRCASGSAPASAAPAD